MSTEEFTDPVGADYAFGQLAKAFVTALSHADPEVRSNAEKRASKWQKVLRGIASGHIRVGSRAPVRDLPAWVTPEVVRGGFATGSAAASGELRPHELEWADRLYVDRSREALFSASLTERGLECLVKLLRDGRYRVAVPEEALLLTVAWLVNHGDIDGAVQLVDVVRPYAGQLCFLPRPGDEPRDLEIVSRETVGEVSRSLHARRPNRRVEAMREALTVWNPFEDEVVTFWLRALDAEPAASADSRFRREAERLKYRYVELANDHRLCSKHRNAKENLAVLVTGLTPYAETGEVPRSVEHAVGSVVRRRGRPGSPEHAALRGRQVVNAAVPGHHLLAKLVVGRLSGLPPDRGVDSIDDLVAPVTVTEAAVSGLPVGTPMPPSVRRALRRAIESTVDDLLERGLVPSAEVLARLVPQIAAATSAAGYPDQAAHWLVAQSYLAFRTRRSLLLLNYEHQVRIDELPWMQHLLRHRVADRGLDAGSSFRRLGELTLHGFPATVIPNPLVEELGVLAREAGLDLPMVEELAADIFMGSFSAKYVRAAQVAADVLGDSAYGRYYGIDFEEIARLAIPKREGNRPAISDEFAAICRRRAGAGDRSNRSVARNGTIIEQAQILTTQNLATLTGPGGLGQVLDGSWAVLAERCFAAVVRLVEKVERNPQPLSTVKDAAYAWRHYLFFLSMAEASERLALVRAATRQLEVAPEHAQRRLAPAMAGLDHVLAGGSFDDGRAPSSARRFLGWTVGRHWLLES